MARSNYQFNKRQKELARMKKKAEKRQSRLDKKALKPDETSLDVQDDEMDSSAQKPDGEENTDAPKIHDKPRSYQ